MTSWNMPPGCSVTDIPGYWDEPEDWMLLERCTFCNCWVSTRDENITRQIQHTMPDKCPGTNSTWDAHDQCPLGHWEDKTPEEIARSLYKSTKKYVIPEHGAHTIECYAGIETFYRCHHCGGEAVRQEF